MASSATDRERTTLTPDATGSESNGPTSAELLPRHLKGTSHFTRMSYARLICADAVPADVRRIVYLDGDILIRRSFDRWSTSTSRAGRSEPASISMRRLPSSVCPTARRLVCPAMPRISMLVFSSSILPRGEANESHERAIEFASEHPDELQWADQDVINVLLGDRCHRLDAQWNLLWGGWGRRTTHRRVGNALPPSRTGASALRPRDRALRRIDQAMAPPLRRPARQPLVRRMATFCQQNGICRRVTRRASRASRSPRVVATRESDRHRDSDFVPRTN